MTNKTHGVYGLHVINSRPDCWFFVGSVPAALGEEVPATDSAVMAGRAFKRNGQILMIKFPTFETREAAIEFARARGFEVNTR